MKVQTRSRPFPWRALALVLGAGIVVLGVIAWNAYEAKEEMVRAWRSVK